MLRRFRNAVLRAVRGIRLSSMVACAIVCCCTMGVLWATPSCGGASLPPPRTVVGCDKLLEPYALHPELLRQLTVEGLLALRDRVAGCLKDEGVAPSAPPP